MKHLDNSIEGVYESSCGHEQEIIDWAGRLGVESAGILTITRAAEAFKRSCELSEHIRGKVVVEIGAGVGLLALAMAKIAKHVYAIEADPAWSWVFVEHLRRHMPRNLTWIFGRAQEIPLRADVAVIFTRSDVSGMLAAGAEKAPKVLMPLQDEPGITEVDVSWARRLAATLE